MAIFANTLGNLRHASLIGQQPVRFAVYHYALRPRIVKPDERIESDEERLYKTVAPADKWEHSSSNFDPLISKITGMITQRGERETARNVMRLTLREMKLIQLLEANIGEVSQHGSIRRPVEIIHEAVNNCSPLLVLHNVVRAGTLYKVPAPPQTPSVATHMAIKFIIEAARDKPKDTRIWKHLAREFIAASQNQGKASQMKIELYKQCEEHRAYANYRTF